MSARILECPDCGMREYGVDNELEPMHRDVQEAGRLQAAVFTCAHAGCAARVVRTAKRLDALEDKGRPRWVALGR